MNRNSREPLIGGRNITVGPKQQLSRGNGVAIGGPREEDDSLDLFSRIRQNHLVSSRNETDPQNVSSSSERRGGSPILARSRMDDLLSADSGKHDYDWLLTPPGTPLISPSRSGDYQPSKVAPRSNSNIRSAAIAKTSRFSGSQTENANSVRPARSSSTTRSSISSSSSFFNTNNRTSVLNTSSASVTSRPASSSSRPTTPGSRPTTMSTSRTAPVSASRSMPLRSSTPTKNRTSSTAPVDRPRSLQNSRPVTPSSRPQTPSTLNSRSNGPPSRSNSRPSTPTRRIPSLPANQSTTVNRAAGSNKQTIGSASRPSSPGPRTQAPKKPLTLPEFPHDAPPNLRTKLPERALSAGRQRPGLALTVRSNMNPETTIQASSNRRQASPVVTRGRLQENSSSVRLNTSASELRPNNKKPVGTDAAAHRPIKPGSPAECTGFGRTISKYSMDMALKHMDIRQSINGIRGASLIPQSIRSFSLKGQPGRSSDPSVAIFNKIVSHVDDSVISDTMTSDNDSITGAVLGD